MLVTFPKRCSQNNIYQNNIRQNSKTNYLSSENNFDKFIPSFKSSEVVTKNSKEFREINQIYQEVAKKPATFFSTIYNYAGEQDKSPAVFKDNNCIGLSLNLKDKLAQKGYKESFLLPLQGSRHHVLLSNIKDNWFIFDPSWSICEPTNITAIFNTPTQKGGVNMLPTLYDKDSKVIYQSYMSLSYPNKNDSNKIEMHMQNSNQSDKGGIFDLTKKLTARPEAENQANFIYTQGQTTLEIKAPNMQTGEKNYLVYPVAKHFDDKIQDKANLYIKDSMGNKHMYGEPEFFKHLKSMSKVVRSEASEIIDYAMYGVELYFKHLPKNFRFLKK